MIVTGLTQNAFSGSRDARASVLVPSIAGECMHEVGPDVLGRVIDRLPLAAIVDHEGGRVLSCNRAARSLLVAAGCEPRAGAVVAELLRAWLRRDAPGHLAAFEAWLASANELPLPVVDRAARHHQIQRVPVPDIGFLWTFQDLTLHRRLEDALRRTTETLEQRVLERTRALDRAHQAAQEAHLSKTRFFAAASHDLLQPLNAARIFASSLAELADLPEHARHVAARIDAALRNAEEVIDVLVDVAKLDTGAVRTVVEEFDLGELLRGLAEQFGAIAQGRRLALRLGPCNYVVASDRRLLRRVLQNLLSNALRYTARGGVLVGVRHQAGGLRVDVVDSGPGLDESQLPRAFEEFQRVGPGSPWGERGLGLGLAICRRICALLGHELEARSRPGRGSRFGVCLGGAYRRSGLQPVREHPAGLLPPALALSVLCVDDDPDALDAMAALIGGWGARVTTASSLAQAQAALAAARHDVLLVDHHLDGAEPADGLAIAARLRAQQAEPALAAILITANRSEDVQAAARAQAVPVLHKPLRAMRLRALLEALARR